MTANSFRITMLKESSEDNTLPLIRRLLSTTSVRLHKLANWQLAVAVAPASYGPWRQILQIQFTGGYLSQFARKYLLSSSTPPDELHHACTAKSWSGGTALWDRCAGHLLSSSCTGQPQPCSTLDANIVSIYEATHLGLSGNKIVNL